MMHGGIGGTYITLDGKEVFNMCTLKRDYYRVTVEGAYSQVEFIEIVHEYFNTPIEDCLNTHNPLVKILVILDRRIGKRTLLYMKGTIENEEDIVKYFYKLRCDSEVLSREVEKGILQSNKYLSSIELKRYNVKSLNIKGSLNE